MIKNEVWGTRAEALKFYGISIGTLVRWSKLGKIKTKEAQRFETRVVNSYLLDDDLRELIENMKSLDNRWT